MKPHMKLGLTALKLGVVAVVAALLFVIVVNAMKSPVEGDTRAYTAQFTDVSGLHENGDVRTRGVQIGKVTSVELTSQDGHTLAQVAFTLKEPYELTNTTELAVKYQNLTGARYVELTVAENPGTPVGHLTTANTKPSFDITQLFNGLQPVLTTMSTDEINDFTENAISLLQGDGGGLAPMLESADKLAAMARDRQQVLSTLTANMARIADTMGSRSPQVMDFLDSLNYSIEDAMTVLDKFQKTAVFGPQFMRPLFRLIEQLGLTHDMDVDQMLTNAFESLPAAADALRLLPASIAGLQLPQVSATSANVSCTNGVATLPTTVQVLLNGSEVVVCNAR